MNKESKQHTCCFIGHRHIEMTEELKNRVYSTIDNLIVNEKVDMFLLDIRSEFNDLCQKPV